jgi:phage FluMu protein Com
MAIEFRCSDCTTRLKAPDYSSGKRVKCPKCASIQTIPGAKLTEAELSHKPEATAPKPTPVPKSTPTENPKPTPAQTKPQTPQIAPLASSSPFGDLGNLANVDLTAGPSVQMAATVLPPSDFVPAAEHREPAPPPAKKQGSAGLMILKIPAIIMILQTLVSERYSNNSNWLRQLGSGIM